jgi:hypothetical protein
MFLANIRIKSSEVSLLQLRVVMAVVVEMHNTGDSATRSEIVALIEHALCEKTGEWHVAIVGSRGKDNWEMKLERPKGLSASTPWLAARANTNREAIRSVLLKLIPAGGSWSAPCWSWYPWGQNRRP